MPIVNPVIISNGINSGTGDDLRVAFTKLNTNIGNVNTYLSNLDFYNLPLSPTAIAYDTENTVVLIADNSTTFAGDLIPSSLTYNLGEENTPWNGLYASNGTITNLTVTGVLNAIGDGGTF